MGYARLTGFALLAWGMFAAAPPCHVTGGRGGAPPPPRTGSRTRSSPGAAAGSRAA